MAFTYKILGQIKPNANTLTNVYVSPAATSTIINTITICNQGFANSTIDLILRPVNEIFDEKHLLLKSFEIPRAETLFFTPGITMNAEVILAANNTLDSNVSISVFGVEVA
jgi:hypothetical protein